MSLYEKNDFAEGSDRLIIAISSDRGLCGGVHTNIGRNIKATQLSDRAVSKAIIVGDKVMSCIVLFTVRGEQYLSKVLISRNDLTEYEVSSLERYSRLFSVMQFIENLRYF